MDKGLVHFSARSRCHKANTDPEKTDRSGGDSDATGRDEGDTDARIAEGGDVPEIAHDAPEIAHDVSEIAHGPASGAVSEVNPKHAAFQVCVLGYRGTSSYLAH